MIAGALARLQLLAAPALVRPDATVITLERKDAALLALLAFDGPTSRFTRSNTAMARCRLG